MIKIKLEMMMTMMRQMNEISDGRHGTMMLMVELMW